MDLKTIMDIAENVSHGPEVDKFYEVVLEGESSEGNKLLT